VANCQFPPFKNYLIRWFIKRYGVNMEEALEAHPEAYPNFNSFFTRLLKPGLRPIAIEENALISPVDGRVSEAGTIQKKSLFQAKSACFDLLSLVGGQKNIASLFKQGKFLTLYLAPKDYHRVHMPFTGKLISMTHVPGQLFSVNPQTAEQVPNLFARNERLICLFETTAGPMAMILVGAMIVASIHTVWAGEITPVTVKHARTWHYHPNYLSLSKGSEMGFFKLGSTVILLFGSEDITWHEAFQADSSVRMGESIGSVAPFNKGGNT